MADQPTEVSQSFDSPRNLKAFVVLNHGLLGLRFFFIVVPFPQIALERNQNKFDAWAVFGNLSDPFRLDVF